MAYDGIAVLPTGTTLNPKYNTGDYADDTSIAFVLWKLQDNRSRPTRVLTGAGPGNGYGWKLETVLKLYHDQTGAQLGDYRIVGIIDYSSGEQAGQVIDYALKHSVLK